MNEVQFLKETIPTLRLSGRIDSTNVAEVEQTVQAYLQDVCGPDLIADAEKLDYSSSAGLRMLLRLRPAEVLHGR